MDVPVAIIIYNRPRWTKRLIENLSSVKPGLLYVISDGPKTIKDKQKVKECRSLVDGINWKCRIKKIYAPSNLGCKKRVSSGIMEVFKSEYRLIILEDDCLPDPSFFRFCAELLKKYENDERIMHISGSNFQFGRQRGDGDYYFSRYAHVWGWATWKRAWKHYDVNIMAWPAAKEKKLLRYVLPESSAYKYWSTIFDKMYRRQIDTWDFQWVLAIWLQGGLAVIPQANLVSNIGFGEEATHTKLQTRFALINTDKMKYPLRHPANILRNYEADDCYQRQLGKFNTILDIGKNRLLSLGRQLLLK